MHVFLYTHIYSFKTAKYVDVVGETHNLLLSILSFILECIILGGPFFFNCMKSVVFSLPHQIGAYFGHSIITADLNGDGLVILTKNCKKKI